MFYREVRDTTPGIQLIRRHDGLRRAHIEAGRTSATVIGDSLSERQGHVNKQLTQKEKRAGFSLQDQGVFTALAKAAAHCQFGFHHGCRIGEHAVSKWS